MSVLIRGMEIPIDCKHCPFLDSEDKFCLASARQTRDGINILDMNCSNIQAGSKHPDCPLSVLPEKHGRLIDGDALLDRFEKESKAADEHGRDFSFCFVSNGEPCAEWWTVMRMVEDAITVAEMTNGG